MASSVKIVGLEALQARLKKNVTLTDIKKVVQKNGRDLQSKMVKNAGESTFNKGYFTGALKQDIAGSGYKESDGGLTVTVGATKDYGPYLEYGTRFMDKEQFAKPSLDEIEPHFKADLKKLVT
jgi:HK97 gp10 family phage protein